MYILQQLKNIFYCHLINVNYNYVFKSIVVLKIETLDLNVLSTLGLKINPML